MKTLCFIIFLGVYSITCAANEVEQEIRYNCKGANEVFIVWGVNNWQLLDEKELPAGSFIKNNLIYTQLEKLEEGKFSARLKVSPGTVIDYVFWITKGLLNKGTDIWDTNRPPQKDFHTLAGGGAVTLIDSAIFAKPYQPLSVLDYSYALLLAAVLACICVYLVKKYHLKFVIYKRPSLIIISSGVSLLMLLFLIRPSVLGISWEIVADPVSQLPRMVGAAYYDALYVVVLTAFFLLLNFFLRRRVIFQNVIAGIFVGFCFFSLLAGVLNIRVVEMLGKPFNYPWLYYSNFLKSADAKSAIAANLTAHDITRMFSLCIFAALATWLLLAALNYFLLEKKRRKIFITCCSFLAVSYCVIAQKELNARSWNYDKLANPVTAFMASVNPFAAAPALFTAQVDDSLCYKKPASKSATALHTKFPGIKNVILFVLESTPAEYVESFGGLYPVTPHIKKYAKQALTFENVYAHAPATNLSMVSLLTSVYPWLSYNSFTQEHPTAKIPSLSEELEKRGYRTGFFNSADNRYQKADEFLCARKFDLVKDCREQTCANAKFEVKNDQWQFMDGKDDACTMNELNTWISADPATPFFGVLWTYQTHYPYFFNGPQKNFAPHDSVFNRYLNALNYADSTFGNLMTHLEKEKLSESTLVVVIGDHGEAFGRHGQISHGRKIYEENLHVPCMLINPAFNEERKSGMGGMVDIAPTIMSYLGFEIPTLWEGENLLAKTKDSRVFFFAPWSEYLFGYREGRFKYIFNASSNTSEMYDLSSDPFEQKNLAGQNPGEVALCHQRLAGWTQYVNKATDRILAQ